jgi:DtxR family transcriptional regulator, Mn-dependent transcriptional regulator
MNSLTLSPAMQDYLEVILELSKQEESVRVTDIAEKLNIAKASVTQAVNALKEFKLVVQDKYGPVRLTKRGREEAAKVRYKHWMLRSFLVNVLTVEPAIAEKDACLMEHVISPQTLYRLVEFMEKSKNISSFEGEIKTVAKNSLVVPSGEVKKMRSVNTSALHELSPGSRGKVLRIAATGSMRRRILEMGVVPGVEIMVEGVAPMGDPIEVSVKDYHLSLRKNEAAFVFVEVH